MLALDPTALLNFAAAQAGGGGSFGGGGGGGGFSGGGGSGDGGFGWLVYLVFRLVLVYPMVGVPLLIVVLVVAVMGTRKGWWAHQERTIHRRGPARLQHTSVVSADVLRGSDPDFDEQRFLARVKIAFQKAQSSWCAQDLEPLRPFVTDGVFERFSLQIEEQRADGWRQRMESLIIGRATIAHVETGAHFDTVTVRIPFQCDISRERIDTGKRISGSQLPRDSFTEMWSFLRRRGAKTLSGEGLIEGKCPNCGAPLTLKQSAKCGSCECLARSGQFDWVLAEITQASVWSAEREADISGLAAFTRSDPGMSVQALEDRASVAFWRNCAAERAGLVDALTRIAEPGYIERRQERLGDRRGYYADCAVGSVRTLGLLSGDDQDRAVVEVVWDGRYAKLGGSGSLDLSPRRSLHHSLLVFARKAGAKTRLGEAFTTMHCQTCGAHDEGGTAPACSFCGAPRTGDPSTWLLVDVLGKSGAQARNLLAELRSPTPELPQPDAPPTSAVELLEWAVAMVRSDGVVDEDERRAVHSLASREDASPELIEALLNSDEPPGATLEPVDPYAGRKRLEDLVRLAHADGKLDRYEKRFLMQAAGHLGLPPAEVVLLINKTRSSLYRESRAVR